MMSIVYIFWMYVILFGLVGWMRGWAKELLVAFSVILALALVLAGGLSNLIDRFVHDGYVVDFINLGVGHVRTGIFNVADVAITVGVVMLLIQSLRSRKRDA